MAKRVKAPPLPVDPAVLAAQEEARLKRKALHDAVHAKVASWFPGSVQQGFQCSYETLYGLYDRGRFKSDFIRVPNFQRPVVWSHEQQVRFCQTAMKGLLCQSFIFWQKYEKDGRVFYVVDGQQRLTALGVPMTRNGVLQEGCKAYLDLEGNWHSTPGEGRFSMWELVRDHIDNVCNSEIPDEQRYLYGALENQLNYFRMCWVVVGSLRDLSAQEAQAIFRTLAIPGVTLTEEDAAKWCELADEIEE